MAEPNDIDPKNLEETRERLARADTSHSPAAQGSGTGTGPAGAAERGPADTAQAEGGPAGGTPPSTGSSGLNSGLQPGGMNPKTGAGGTGDLHGSISTPGPGSS
ncbi:hypothetical protein [Azospirillum sp. SYSU D00513]|uniref:hypothetical protein n=1 Tax=Azospirillum sp. SYSU D00513 TaxID=2812561 RepID=UPI001A96BEE4|nr:hypothetical protein [Azospirillum sp. SYSU D00513]